MRLTDAQIDKIVCRYRRHTILGLTLIMLPFVLPRGWGAGFFSGYMLFSLGVYSLWFRNWRTEPGLWMLAVFLTIVLGTSWIFFEALYWQGILRPPVAKEVGKALQWDQILLSIDTTVALLLFANIVRLTATIAVENWRRTRNSDRNAASSHSQIDGRPSSES